LKPLKELGQNFLNDSSIAAEIAALADLKHGERIWEIGPGKGILTNEILAYDVDLTAFELDRRLEQPLKERFGNKLNLIRSDVLRVNWQELLDQSPQNVKLVANIPYQITSPLLSRLEEHRARFDKVVLMVQKEVAERLTAKVGTKDYGLMTIRMQLVFDIEIGLQVNRVFFDPAPNVDSAVIVMRPRQDSPRHRDPELFYRLIHHAFQHRRKTLRNNLLHMMTKLQLAALEKQSRFDLTRRGETFSETEFIDLCDLIAALTYSSESTK
jgi:16S rRNA (adenine1518-N6/adenine1519-N6)-dimethyltransferase